MKDRIKELHGLIENNSIDQALEIIQNPEGFKESEDFVDLVFREENCVSELVEASLESYLKTKPTYSCYVSCHGDPSNVTWISKGFGFWVHSFSHFIGTLWERRMDEWLTKFYKTTFESVLQFNDSHCSNRLVGSFANRARWDDDPADFYLTPKNLCWMDWKYYAYAKARIEMGRFESEEDFLRWKIHQPETCIHFSNDLVDSKNIRSIIQQLKQMGADVSEFDNFEKNLLTTQLSKLQEELQEATDEWVQSQMKEKIQSTLEALEQCA